MSELKDSVVVMVRSGAACLSPHNLASSELLDRPGVCEMARQEVVKVMVFCA